MIKFLTLQVVGVGLAVAAYLSGWFSIILEADRLHLAPVFGILTLLGLWMVATRRSEGATWLSNIQPVLALVGTVAGVLVAVNGIDASNLDQARIQIFTGTAHSLVSNLLGMLAYLWLSLSIKVRDA